MWTVTIGVLISALFCASHSDTIESKECVKTTRVQKKLSDYSPEQKDAMKNGLNRKELPPEDTAVFSFNKTVSNRRTAENGMKAHIVLYIAADKDIYGYFNFNGNAWGFHPITEDKVQQLC
ncbi:hypothetical protein COOONC_09776 [Cooperia oncophora]